MRKLLLIAPVILLISAGAAGAEALPSEACLSCHGGLMGPEIRRNESHPYDVDYAAALRRQQTLRRASAPSGFGGTIEQDLLVDGKVTCVSCHVDHDQDTGAIFRLRLASTPSNLCRTCHEID